MNPNYNDVESRRLYQRVHFWIWTHYGKADRCETKDCKNKPKRFEWALIKAKPLEKNIENFMQLCASCHRKYDFTEETRKKDRHNTNKQKTHCKRGHEFNDMNTYWCGKNKIWRMCIICNRANTVKWRLEHN